MAIRMTKEQALAALAKASGGRTTSGEWAGRVSRPARKVSETAAGLSLTCTDANGTEEVYADVVINHPAEKVNAALPVGSQLIVRGQMRTSPAKKDGVPLMRADDPSKPLMNRHILVEEVVLVEKGKSNTAFDSLLS